MFVIKRGEWLVLKPWKETLKKKNFQLKELTKNTTKREKLRQP